MSAKFAFVVLAISTLLAAAAINRMGAPANVIWIGGTACGMVVTGMFLIGLQKAAQSDSRRR